jgi:hypothetical protein
MEIISLIGLGLFCFMFALSVMSAIDELEG